MKKYIATMALSLTLTLGTSTAQADYLIDDTGEQAYWGAGVTGQENTGNGGPANYKTGGDVYDPYGGSEGFDLTGMSVSITNGNLMVTILSDTYFNNWIEDTFASPRDEVAPGTLFLSTTGWNPQGTGPHYGQDKMNPEFIGTVWDLAAYLDGIYEPGAMSGTVALYNTADGEILNTGIRDAQETYFDPTGATAVGGGIWEFINNNGIYSLQISMDLNNLIQAGWDPTEELGLHWTNLAADDVVEGAFPGNGSTAVPEPGTLLLFGAGLTGLAAFARRRRMD